MISQIGINNAPPNQPIQEQVQAPEVKKRRSLVDMFKNPWSQQPASQPTSVPQQQSYIQPQPARVPQQSAVPQQSLVQSSGYSPTTPLPTKPSPIPNKPFKQIKPGAWFTGDTRNWEQPAYDPYMLKQYTDEMARRNIIESPSPFPHVSKGGEEIYAGRERAKLLGPEFEYVPGGYYLNKNDNWFYDEQKNPIEPNTSMTIPEASIEQKAAIEAENRKLENLYPEITAKNRAKQRLEEEKNRPGYGDANPAFLEKVKKYLH